MEMGAEACLETGVGQGWRVNYHREGAAYGSMMIFPLL